jgi:uncharacterized SAM-binding protein YcdF (DUF218 family)
MFGYGALSPPNALIALCFFSALVALVWRRTGVIIMLAAGFGLFVAATPAFSSCLLVWLEQKIPNDVDLASARAIVALGADFRSGDERTPDRLGPQSLERLFWTVDAVKQLHLPVVVSGGRPMHLRTTIAQMMKITLEQYFAVPVAWSEEQSETTYENAADTAQLLQKAGIGAVVVIAQARDLPRAIWSFERVGLHAVAWPAPRADLEVDQMSDYLPNTGALNETLN